MSELSISTDLVAQLTREVAAHGARRTETGGFLLARAGKREHLDILALAGSSGIGRSSDLFVISAGAIERLFTWAGEQELVIRAQVHSHREQAFLSRTDLRHGFAVQGFITSVIPTYRTPPGDPARWGWWRCEGTGWTRARAPAARPGRVFTVSFDEDGVREH